MNESKNTTSYDNTVHRLGRVSTIIMLLALVAVPTATAILFNVQVDVNKTVTAFLGAFSLFGVIGTIEFFSYAPVLGAGGQYLSSITGNISNMKLPAALSGIKLSKFEPGSKEAEVVSTIAIAISSLVTTAIVFLGMLFISMFLPILQSPVLAPAFSNMMPALMGALAVPYFMKDFKTASVPCLIAAILTLVLGYSTVAGLQSYLMPVFLILTVLWTRVLFAFKKKEQKVESTQEQK